MFKTFQSLQIILEENCPIALPALNYQRKIKHKEECSKFILTKLKKK